MGRGCGCGLNKLISMHNLCMSNDVSSFSEFSLNRYHACVCARLETAENQSGPYLRRLNIKLSYLAPSLCQIAPVLYNCSADYVQV